MALLLDTCAAIWLAGGTEMSRPAISAIDAAAARGDVLVSPVSAWEVGMLARSRLRFEPSPRDWFARLLGLPGVRLVPLTIEAAIDASFLPGRVHGDPADRLLIATARHLSAAIVTRDKAILAYSSAGHVQTVAC